MDVVLHSVPGAVHVERPGRAFLAAIRQRGTVLDRPLVLFTGGDVLQTGSVRKRHSAPLALPAGLARAQAMRVDTRALPGDLTVRLRVLSAKIV